MLDQRRISWGAVLAVTAAVLLPSPAAALPGLLVATTTTVGPDAWGVHTAVATCPTGTQLTGGGGNLVTPARVRLEAVSPQGGGQSLYAAGIGQGFSLTTTLTAYAICASGMSGYEIVQAESQPPAGSFLAEATAVCPAGKRLIGAGGNSAGKLGYILDGIWISPDLTRVYVRTIRTPDGSPDTAPLARAYAICIDPVPGQQRVMAGTVYSDKSFQSISVNCPAGTRLHGLGGMLGGGAGYVGIQSLRPIGPASVTGASVAATIPQHLKYTGFWRAEVYAICAP